MTFETLKWIGIIIPFILSTWYRLPHADVDAIDLQDIKG